MCDESAEGFDATACLENVVGRTKADLQHELMHRDAPSNALLIEKPKKRTSQKNMSQCARRFYTYTFEQFEEEFPYLASCRVSTYAAVVHATVLNDPCRTSNKSAADFLIPPPYLAQECNWPTYGGSGGCRGANLFRQGHQCKDNVARAFVKMQSRSGNKSILVIDHNSDWTPYNLPAVEYSRRDWVWAKVNSKPPYYRPDVDVSMPPPATAHCTFVPDSASEEPLESKRFFISFRGQFESRSMHRRSWEAQRKGLARSTRKWVHNVLHNGRDRIIVDSSRYTATHKRKPGCTIPPCFEDVYDFDMLLRSSRFILIIGGDVEFSYRFNEAVCSGGVPVLITQAWVPPFNEFVPFESYGVLVNETNETQMDGLLHILQTLPEAEVERRRKMARKMCVDAFQTTEKTISALLHFQTSAASVTRSMS
jgi:hypothetical protein